MIFESLKPNKMEYTHCASVRAAEKLCGTIEKLFCKLLDFTSLSYVAEPVLTNRVFAEWINRGLHGKKYKEFVRKFNDQARIVF